MDDGKNKMNVLVTGANGFVGKQLCADLTKQGLVVKAAVRKHTVIESCIPVVTGNIDNTTHWSDALPNVDVVIHTAARVHIMDDSSVEPLTEFRKINTAGTLNLARQAAEAGVKRFIFLSSIKVNGEMSGGSDKNCPHPSPLPGGEGVNSAFTEKDSFIPADPYGLSKYEAEQGLLALAKETGLEVVIIRPPLIYGPGVKANFSSMMRWVNKGFPLPFGTIHNQRSLVALDNLVSFIIHCIDHPKAANEVFLISDGEDVSTTELLQKVAKALGKKSRLIPVPVWFMTLLAKLVGKSDMANRLFGSLQVDSSKAQELLGWKPVITMDEQLAKIVDVSAKGIVGLKSDLQ